MRLPEPDSCGCRRPTQSPALLEDAVHARDSGQPDEADDLLRQALRAAGDLGYL